MGRVRATTISWLAILLLGAGFGKRAGAQEVSLAPGEVLLRWEEGRAKPAARMELAGLAEKYGLVGEVPLWPAPRGQAKPGTAWLGPGPWVKLTFSAAADPREMAAAYARLEGVACAQPNYLRRLTSAPDDSLFGQQWSLQALGWDWGRQPRADGVVVAIIDSGVDWHHPDLAGQVWENAAEAGGRPGIDDDENGYVDDLRGWDFSDAPGMPGEGDYLERDADPDDESGHGTHVAGIVGAHPDNRIGIAGMAPGARLMVLRAGFNIGGGGFLEDDDVAAAIVYAADQGAGVINMSFGDPNFSPLIRDVVRYAAQAGCTMVAAVGNENSEAVFYPARLPEVIAVGATGRGNGVLAFSNSGYSLDLAAPGSAVLSLLPGGQYGERSGTSMAAAHVSGVAALVLGRHPEYSPVQVRGALLRTALDLGEPGWDPLTGAGLVQVEARKVEQPSTLQLSGEPTGGDTVRVQLGMSGEGAFDLSWGQGEEPAAWFQLEQGSLRGRRLLTLNWPTAGLAAGSYLLRGRFFTPEKVLEERVAVVVDGRTGLAGKLRVYPALDGGSWAQVAEWESAGSAADTLFIHREEEREPLYQIAEFSSRPLHRVRLPEDLPAGRYRAQVGEKGPQVDFAVDDEPVSRWSMDLKGLLPDGYLLPALSDFNGNGLQEAAAMLYRGNRYNPVEFFEAGQLPATHRSSLLFIPWAQADLDGDGLGELVGVDAQRVRLIEAAQPGAFPSQPVWEQQDAWGGEVADLDGDGREELLLRSARAPLFQVFEGRGNNRLAETGVLTNPSGGSNELGERQLAADLDGDGLGELLSGDGDGDLFIYEAIGDDAYHLTWKEEGQQPSADARLVGGGADLDGDGMVEFIVGRLYQDPYDVQQTRWLIEVYQAGGDNTYVREWQVEALGGKAGGNGINTGDWDGDGELDFAVALPPHLYVMSASGTDTYHPVWQGAATDVHQPASGDLDGDGLAELLFNTGEGIGIFSRHQGLARPAGLRAHAVDEGRVALEWGKVAEATAYRVYRDGVLIQTLVIAPQYEDGGLQAGREYQYTVRALVGDQESPPSDPVRVRPQARPRVLAVERLAERQLGVRFDQGMAQARPYRFHVDPGVGFPSSALLDQSGRRMVLGFDQALPDSGYFTLVLQGVESALGGPLSTASFAFELTPYAPPARVVAARVTAPGQVAVQFSRPIARAERQNFAFTDQPIQVVGVQSLGEEVLLKVEPPLQPLGRPYELQIRRVVAEGGSLVEGRVLLEVAAADLSQVRFFPNPFRPAQGRAIFGYLPQRAEVRIFDLSGRLLQVLTEDEGDGGVPWDGIAADGKLVPSGVYLFWVRSGGTEHHGKLAVIRD